MNFQRLAAFAAALVLLLALAWWQTSDPVAASPGKPTYNGPVGRGLRADVPQLTAFETFNVNPDNPFIPLDQRIKDKIIGLPPPPAPPKPKDSPPTRHEIPPRPAPIITEVPLKPVQLPTLTPAAATAPQCIGLIGGEESQLLVVRMPGAETSVQLKVGGMVDGWTLVAIDNSNQAHFTDPSGTPLTFPIGDGDLAVAQTLVSPGSDAPSKPAKAGEGALINMPKAPTPAQNGKGQGGQGNGARKPRRPGAPGQGQGPVPTPGALLPAGGDPSP
jgi:hypothetical protein